MLWKSVAPGDLGDEMAKAMLSAPDRFRVAPADIAFVVPNHGVGLEAITQIERAEESQLARPAHVFAKGREMQRHLKKAFGPGRGESKGSTLHSFQGWEARCVVLGIPPIGIDTITDPDNEFVRAYWAALYVGLTRVATSVPGSYLIVLNAEPSTEGFFRHWFNSL